MDAFIFCGFTHISSLIVFHRTKPKILNFYTFFRTLSPLLGLILKKKSILLQLLGKMTVVTSTSFVSCKCEQVNPIIFNTSRNYIHWAYKTFYPFSHVPFVSHFFFILNNKTQFIAPECLAFYDDDVPYMSNAVHIFSSVIFLWKFLFCVLKQEEGWVA